MGSRGDDDYSTGNGSVTPKATRAAINGHGGTSVVARATQQNRSTVKRWKQNGVDGPPAILLRLLASGKITIQDVEQAHD